jgi:hypothetical protein
MQENGTIGLFYFPLVIYVGSGIQVEKFPDPGSAILVIRNCIPVPHESTGIRTW